MEAKTYTKKELTEKYNITYPTLKKWIKPILPKLNISEKEYNKIRIFNSKQSRIIIEHLG